MRDHQTVQIEWRENVLRATETPTIPEPVARIQLQDRQHVVKSDAEGILRKQVQCSYDLLQNLPANDLGHVCDSMAARVGIPEVPLNYGVVWQNHSGRKLNDDVIYITYKY